VRTNTSLVTKLPALRAGKGPTPKAWEGAGLQTVVHITSTVVPHRPTRFARGPLPLPPGEVKDVGAAALAGEA